MNNRLFSKFALMSAVAALMTQNLLAQDQEPTSSWESIPDSAFAFIHIDLNDLSDVSSLSLPVELISGIQNEIDQVFEKQAGIRPTEILDVSIVVPTIESAIAVESDPGSVGVCIAAFKNPVDSRKIAESLNKDWKHEDIDGRSAFVNSETNMCIFHHIDNTLAIGKVDLVQWFIDNRSYDEESHLQNAKIASKYGQLIVNVSGESLTDEMKQLVPEEFKSLANLNYASFSIDLHNGFELNGVVEFNSSEDAKHLSKLANGKVQEGLELLANLEATTLQQLAGPDQPFGSAVDSLVMLAGCRYGKKLLAQTEVTQFRNQLLAHFRMEEFESSVAFFALGAIQTIGQPVEGAFEDVPGKVGTSTTAYSNR